MTDSLMQTVGVVFVTAFFSLLVIFPPQAAPASYATPDTIDTTSKYLFFFHNLYVEINGPDGDCRYEDLLTSFTEKGFVVVSSLRSQEVDPLRYAEKAAEQIQVMLKAGVPPDNITVCGHSKGAVIALNIAALLQQPEMRFILLAGCEIELLASAYPDPLMVQGRFLSLYAQSDRIAASCSPFLASNHQGVSTRELILDSPKGHRLFFEPDISWLSYIESAL